MTNILFSYQYHEHFSCLYTPATFETRNRSVLVTSPQANQSDRQHTTVFARQSVTTSTRHQVHLILKMTIRRSHSLSARSGSIFPAAGTFLTILPSSLQRF